MKLYYSKFDEKIRTIEEKMVEMVVAHELVEQQQIKRPRLEFGQDSVEGEQAILDYLEDLYRDMKKGYYCAC